MLNLKCTTWVFLLNHFLTIIMGCIFWHHLCRKISPNFVSSKNWRTFPSKQNTNNLNCIGKREWQIFLNFFSLQLWKFAKKSYTFRFRRFMKKKKKAIFSSFQAMPNYESYLFFFNAQFQPRSCSIQIIFGCALTIFYIHK